MSIRKTLSRWVIEREAEARGVAVCEVCWSQAVEIAERTGQSRIDLYREVCRQPRSHCHGLPITTSGIISSHNPD